MPRNKQFDEAETLEKAMELFWAQGYHGTSYNDLVEHLGINRASIYHTYGDKHQLYRKALARYCAKNHQALKTLLRSPVPFREKLDRMLTTVIEETLNDPQQRGCFVVNTTTELAADDPEIATMVQENRETVEGFFHAAIYLAQEKGELKPDQSPEALAHFLFNHYLGLRVMAKLRPEKKHLEQIKDLLLSHFL